MYTDWWVIDLLYEIRVAGAIGGWDFWPEATKQSCLRMRSENMLIDSLFNS